MLYLAGAARTYFDEDAANKVLERERASHRKQVEAGRAKVKPEDFAPPIARLLREARMRELRIGDAIARADLPFDEVGEEIDRFVAAMESTAARAQLLYEALGGHAARRGSRRGWRRCGRRRRSPSSRRR